MTSTKPPIPPVNLKDRIAALQQRNAGSTQGDSKHSVHARHATGSLKDKIASFEKQGAVPVPRGSFGLGAPPVDDGTSRRRGELIGNRVPGLSRPVAPAPNPLRPTSPSSPGRRRAVSATIQDTASSRSVSPTFSNDGEADLFGSPESALEDPTSSRLPRHPPSWQARRRSVSEMVVQLTPPPMTVEPLPETPEDTDTAPTVVVPSESETLGDQSDIPWTPSPPTQQMSNEGPSAPSLPATAEVLVSSCPEDGPTVSEGQLASAGEEPKSSASEQTPSVAPDVQPEGVVGSVVDSEQCMVAPMVMSSTSQEKSQADDLVLSPPISLPAISEPSEDPHPVTEETTFKGGVGIVELSATIASSSANTNGSPPHNNVDLLSPPTAVLPKASIPTESKVHLIDEAEEQGNISLALDTNEAIIVTEPHRVVTPVLTRAVLVPVSPVSPPLSAMAPTLPSPTLVESSLTPKMTQGSFCAVEHHKIAEGHRHEGSSQARRVSDLRVAVDSPQSPSFGDLADLMADAALLEQQLSVLGSPRRTGTSPSVPRTLPPTSGLRDVFAPRVEITVSEQQESKDDFSVSGDGHGSSEYESPQEFPTIPEPRTPSPSTPPKEWPRSRVLSDSQPQTPGPATPSREYTRSRLLSDTPPPVPPKSPRPRYFSTLLSRRPSAKDGLYPMPGAYPRDSVCSEMSEDDSVLATPPSPRFDYRGSDTSSVVSSSRSWKMPSKGLARATSFADRLWHKRNNRNTVVIASPGKQHLHVRKSTEAEPYMPEAGHPDDDVHLSPGSARPRKSSPTPTLPKLKLSADPRVDRQGNGNREERPSSWVSVSSIGSGGLDSALFDAFPSVPETVPAISLPAESEPSSHTFTSANNLGAPSASRSSRFPPPRTSSLHPKQRSSIL